MADTNRTAIVNVHELRNAAELLLAEVATVFGPDVDLEGDHYWLLELDEAHGSADPPAVSSAGSLVDDVESVRELLARDPEEGVYLWHDLSHLIGVLARIAELDRRRISG